MVRGITPSGNGSALGGSAVLSEREPLSAERVIDAALELCDAEGVQAMTLARLSKWLGCHVTSLYTYVDSADDLRAQAAIQVQSALARRVWKAALGRSGEDALREIALTYRSFGSEFPARVRLLLASAALDDPRIIDGAHELAEPIRASLRGLGLGAEQIALAHRAYSGAIRGFLTSDLAGLYGDQSDATFEYVIDVTIAGITA